MQPAEKARVRRQLPPGSDGHGPQAGQDGQVTCPIEEEAPFLANLFDQEAGQRRPDEPRGVDHRRIQRDGIGQILSPGHHFG